MARSQTPIGLYHFTHFLFECELTHFNSGDVCEVNVEFILTVTIRIINLCDIRIIIRSLCLLEGRRGILGKGGGPLKPD